MEELIDLFKASLSPPVRSKTTQHNYDLACRRFWEWMLLHGYQGLEDLSHSALQDFVHWMATHEQLASTTIKLNVSGLKAFFAFARDIHGVDVPAQGILRVPRTKKPLPVVLKEQAIAAYLKVALQIDDPYKTALILLPFTGLRISEMTRLRLRDVHMDEPPWIQFEVTGKSMSDRLVPMIDAGANFFRDYIIEVRPHLTPGPQDMSEPLFPNLAGNFIDQKVLARHMRDIRRELGIEHLTAHKLRHTYATILHENGITGFDLARVMGHENPRTTSIYVHPDDDDLRKRVADIDVDV